MMSKRARELALQGKRKFITERDDKPARKQQRTFVAGVNTPPESPCPSGSVDEGARATFLSDIDKMERTSSWIKSTSRFPQTNGHVDETSKGKTSHILNKGKKLGANPLQAPKRINNQASTKILAMFKETEHILQTDSATRVTTKSTATTECLSPTQLDQLNNNSAKTDFPESLKSKTSPLMKKQNDWNLPQTVNSPETKDAPETITAPTDTVSPSQPGHANNNKYNSDTLESSGSKPLFLMKTQTIGKLSQTCHQPKTKGLALPTGHITPITLTNEERAQCRAPIGKHVVIPADDRVSPEDKQYTKDLPQTSSLSQHEAFYFPSTNSKSKDAPSSARRKLDYDLEIPEEIRDDEELTTALMNFNNSVYENLSNNLTAIEDLHEDVSSDAQLDTQEMQMPANFEEFPPPDPSNAAPPGNPAVQQERPSSRKRMCNPSKWKKNVVKQLFNTGQEHLNLKGKLIAARKMGEGCPISCRYKCHTRISLEERQLIFNEYWKLGNKTAQWHFVNNMTAVCKPAQHKNPKSKARENSRKYYFKSQGKLQRVCQKMFLSTLAISESVCKTATERMKTRHTLTPDKRGKKKKNLSDLVGSAVNSNIHKHISKFPAIPSHLCRARSQRKYLEEGLSVRKMYRMYSEWMKKKNPTETIATERQYRDYFCENFNYGFYQPKKDQCDLCCVYSNCNEKQRKNIQDEYDNHTKLKEEARTQKKEDKKSSNNSPETLFVCFDLQKVLATPKCKAGSLYYKRKWSVYNFTMFDGTHSEGYCYVWHEGEANRGANEIASCIHAFVKEMVEKFKIKVFLFWSDNCGGQNKNKYIFALYTLLCAQFNVKIIHRFLEKGHTQNEADSVHAQIEKFSKSTDVYTPSQWYKIIEEAKSNGSPYKVIRMNGEMKNYHILAHDHQQWMNHKNAKWKSVREISCNPENPTILQLKHRLTANAPVIEVNVKKRTKGHPINLKTYKVPTAYHGPLQLKASKLKDLATLCNELTIPSQYHQEYLTLKGIQLNHSGESSDDDDISDGNDSAEEQGSRLEDDDSDAEPNYEGMLDTPEKSVPENSHQE